MPPPWRLPGLFARRGKIRGYFGGVRRCARQHSDRRQSLSGRVQRDHLTQPVPTFEIESLVADDDDQGTNQHEHCAAYLLRGLGFWKP
jgi:hypothetical protein